MSSKMPWACFRRARSTRPSANAKRASPTRCVSGRSRDCVFPRLSSTRAGDPHPRAGDPNSLPTRPAPRANHLPGMALHHHLACPILLRSPGSSPGPCHLESGNNGGNDLTPNWALKHGFLRACKHRPRRPSASAPPQAVPNRGLAAVTLVRCLAFVLSPAFTLRHARFVRRY